ncbi:DUF4167 domain-containing protein [Novosphingobium piscinae]|uniref:DUF4167 domain-containing protein n=1 Tax=Novosphingobium piscinae TaxID=1507448 RepID=UPI001FE5EA12|nr:DUF4167 domain-containing protein [Novosphingobium piscinae]
MNNNRGNNRRRGRGNNRPQGGGQQLNRIDSRARGNAPQLLEKYRKLAQDAHQNGDRVLAEYYLQFADHYFRVIADTRTRQEEQRRPRDERWQEASEEGDDAGEFSGDSDFAFDQPVYTRREREDREPREPRDRDRDQPREREAREPREPRERPQRERDTPRRDEPVAEPAAEANGGDEAASVYEPAENPFVRGTRGLRPRREDRRPRRDTPRDEPAAAVAADEGEAPARFDAALLPPSFAVRDEAPASDDAEAAPAPKRRGRKPKAAAPVGGEG